MRIMSDLQKGSVIGAFRMWLVLDCALNGTLSRNVLMSCSFVGGVGITLLQIHFMERAEFNASNLMHSMPIALAKAIPILCYTLCAKT